MDEQRRKVLSNKRRISMIHREKINEMQTQWATRGRTNPNKVTSMVPQSVGPNNTQKSKLKNVKSPKKNQSKKSDVKEDEKMD